MKSQEELVAHLQGIVAEDGDLFGFKREAALLFLNLEHVRALFSETQIKDLVGEPRPYTREAVLECMRQYMPRAWEKAHAERGISAGRSVQKFEVWVWILGEYDQIDWKRYATYGKPILHQICKRYGFPEA